MNAEEQVNYVERRRAKRIQAPAGTTAILKDTLNSIDAVHVLNIGVGGMLICGNSVSEEFDIDSFIDEVIIDVPSTGVSSECRVCLVVNNARVVRSSLDKASQTMCYAISFLHENTYVIEKLEKLVNSIESA